MDNRLFNVNGSGDEMLLNTLELVFSQSGFQGAQGWIETTDHGLILLWHVNEGSNKFPSKLNGKQCFELVKGWLSSEFAKTVKLDGWCRNADHDGHNTKGWQVYCEDWGHVANNHHAICGIRPAFMWHGK